MQRSLTPSDSQDRLRDQDISRRHSSKFLHSFTFDNGDDNTMRLRLIVISSHELVFRSPSRRVHPSTVWTPKATLKAGRSGDAPSP